MQVGVHRSMNIITKGEGVRKRIALCNKVHEGVHVSPMPPPPWIRYWVTLITCSYMCKNGGEAPGQDAVGAIW